MMALAAYLTRGIQLAMGTSKRAAAERAEELRGENDQVEADTIPLADVSRRASEDNGRTPFSSEPSSRPISTVPSSVSLDTLAPPPASQAASHIFLLEQTRSNARPSTREHSVAAMTSTPSLPAQVPLPAPRAQMWAALLTRHFDCFIYLALFMFVGVPIYYVTGYAMPAHLSLTVLCYFVALAVPPTLRQYIHPVPVTALLAVLCKSFLSFFLLFLATREASRHVSASEAPWLAPSTSTERKPLIHGIR